MRFDSLRRREFITLLGGAAVTWPFAVRRRARKQPTIGYIGGGGPITQRAWVEAFVQRLRELGWIRAAPLRSVRWGRDAPALCRDRGQFVRLKVDVISQAQPKQRCGKEGDITRFRSSSRRRETRSAVVRSLRWRDRAATSPAYQTREVIFLPNASDFCARLSQL